jgi:hypothetical protein
MGIVFVLALWAVAGTVVAAIGAAVLGGVAAMFTRRVTSGRRRAVIAASVFPFVCLGWGGVVFVFQAVVNEVFLHRDLGMGDTWHAPLPNGYQIQMIDVTDQGWVYKPGTQADAISGVRKMQVADSYILGATDSKSFEHLGMETAPADGYVLLDMRLGKALWFSDYDALQRKAREFGVDAVLRPIDAVYSQFRFTWFDGYAVVLLLLPPAGAGVLLIRWIVRLRRMSTFN